MKLYVLMGCPNDQYYGDMLATEHIFTEDHVKWFKKQYGEGCEGTYYDNYEAFDVLNGIAGNIRTNYGYYFQEVTEMEIYTFKNVCNAFNAAHRLGKEIELDEDFGLKRVV